MLVYKKNYESIDSFRDIRYKFMLVIIYYFDMYINKRIFV